MTTVANKIIIRRAVAAASRISFFTSKPTNADNYIVLPSDPS